jgi:hypothetical protein
LKDRAAMSLADSDLKAQVALHGAFKCRHDLAKVAKKTFFCSVFPKSQIESRVQKYLTLDRLVYIFSA